MVAVAWYRSMLGQQLVFRDEPDNVFELADQAIWPVS